MTDSRFDNNHGGSTGAWSVKTARPTDMGQLTMSWNNVSCSGNIGGTGGCLMFGTPSMLSTRFNITSSRINGNKAIFGGGIAGVSRWAQCVLDSDLC